MSSRFVCSLLFLLLVGFVLDVLVGELSVGGLSAGSLFVQNAHAQMFSSGSPRSSLSEKLRSRQQSRRGTGPEASENIGDVEGTERFVRGNRSVQDFVGADAMDQDTFVGSQVDISRDVRTAVEDLRPTRERDLNEQIRQSRGKQLYLPRLRVNFAHPTLSSDEVSSQLVHQLSATETLHLVRPIEVSVQDGTATLRGVVASAHDREIAAILARFEPGISSVKNEIQVRSPRSSGKADRRSQEQRSHPASKRAPSSLLRGRNS